MQRQTFPSAITRPQAVKKTKVKAVSTPRTYPSAVRVTVVRRKKNGVLSLAIGLLAFTAKSVAKGLMGMIRFAFRLPGLFAQSVKVPQRTQAAQ